MPSPYAPPRSARLTNHPSDDALARRVGTLVNGEMRSMAVFAGPPDTVASNGATLPRAGTITVRFEKFGDHDLWEIRGYVQDDVYAGDRRVADCAFDAYSAVGAAAILRVVRDRIAEIGPIRSDDPEGIRRLADEVLRQGPPIDPTP